MFEIGSSLREARLRHGYELAEAEAATKIRNKYLRALEEERFELLPSTTYVKGFLRSYAEFLGLDGQLYADEFNSRYSADEEEIQLRSGRRRPPSRAHRRVESRFVLVALAGIATLTALVVIAWKWGAPDAPGVANLGSGGAAATTQSAPASPPPAAQAVDLVLAAVGGNSHVAVRRGSSAGDVVFEGTIENGRSMRFEGKKLWLSVASPQHLVARLNGKVRKLPGKSRPVVVVATPKGLARVSS